MKHSELIGDAVIDRMAEKIAGHLGLDPRGAWRRQVAEAADQVLRKRGLAPSQLFEIIDSDFSILAELASYLTVGETYFLRIPNHFSYLDDYFSEKARLKDTGDVFKIWSAGCAGGEEAYSIAIALTEAVKSKFLGAKFEILADDVNPLAIKKATQGVYNSWSFRGTPAWVISRYFSGFPGGGLSIAESVRRHVTFGNEGILQRLEKTPADSFNCIFFRNVAIYLEPRAIEKIYLGMDRVLRPGGVLIVAPADPRPSEGLFIRVEHESSSIYMTGKGFRASDRTQASSKSGEGGRPSKATPSFKFESLPATAKRTTFTAAHLPSISPASTGPSSRKPIQNGLRPVDFSANPETVIGLGNKGDVEQALKAASLLVQSEPTSKAPYLLRGQLYLAAEKRREAVEDFRRALFLDPEEIIGRYWFAAALNESGERDLFVKQLEELHRRLSALPGDTRVEDGETTCSQMLKAVTYLRMSAE